MKKTKFLFLIMLLITGMISLNSCSEKSNDKEDEPENPADNNTNTGGSSSSPDNALLGIWVLDDYDYGYDYYALSFEKDKYVTEYSSEDGTAYIVTGMRYTYDPASKLLLIHYLEWDEDERYIIIYKVTGLNSKTLSLAFVADPDDEPYSYSNDMKIINRYIRNGYNAYDEGEFYKFTQNDFNTLLKGLPKKYFQY